MRQWNSFRLEIRFPLATELSWDETTTDADVIDAILESDEVLDDIITAALASVERYLFIKFHHWKLHHPLCVLTNIDLDILVHSLYEEKKLLECRILWN